MLKSTMNKRQFPLWYFAFSMAMLLVIQTFLLTPRQQAVKQTLSEERFNKLKYDGKSTLPFMTVRVEDSKLTQDLDEAGITYRGEASNTWPSTILSWVVPAILFLLLWSFLMGKVGAGAGLMQIGKSKAKVFIENKTGVTFADVEGIDEAKDELMEVVEFLKNPGQYHRLGGHIPKGVSATFPPARKMICRRPRTSLVLWSPNSA